MLQPGDFYGCKTKMRKDELNQQHKTEMPMDSNRIQEPGNKINHYFIAVLLSPYSLGLDKIQWKRQEVHKYFQCYVFISSLGFCLPLIHHVLCWPLLKSPVVWCWADASYIAV